MMFQSFSITRYFCSYQPVFGMALQSRLSEASIHERNFGNKVTDRKYMTHLIANKLILFMLIMCRRRGTKPEDTF